MRAPCLPALGAREKVPARRDRPGPPCPTKSNAWCKLRKPFMAQPDPQKRLCYDFLERQPSRKALRSFQGMRLELMIWSNRTSFSRRAIVFLFVLFGIPIIGCSASLEEPERELARKIAAMLPQGQGVTLEIRNRSSLSPEEVARITQALKTELQNSGVRQVSGGSEAPKVVVTLSENLQSLIWTGEIREGDLTRVVVTRAFRTPQDHPGAGHARIILQDEKFWSGQQSVLDAAVINSQESGPVLLLLTSDSLRIATNGPGLMSRVSFPRVEHVSRDGTGSISVSGNVITAAYVQQICTVALDSSSLIECDPTERPPAGRVYELLTLVPPAPPHPDWGDLIVKMQSECEIQPLFLVTGAGDYTQPDSIELRSSDPAGNWPAGNPIGNRLNFTGPVMALHPAGTGATAIVHNLETGEYEAHRVSVVCQQ